jgi:hypothetical protein
VTVVRTDLLVLGSGSLARALCTGIATVADREITVGVLARDEAAAAQAAYLGAVRASQTGRPVHFSSRGGDLTDPQLLGDAVDGVRIVVQCASLYSPWNAAPALKALANEAGFGVTLPLQAALAVQTATAIQRTASAALMVNGCYPDAVNPLLARLGLPIFCGIGNVATLAAGLRTQLGSDGRLRMLAHHNHLHRPERPDDEALAWLDGDAVAEVGKLLGPQRRTDRRLLNQVTGFAAAQLLASVFAGREHAANLPGPMGRPGGYPVRVTGPAIDLDLPPEFDEPAAIAWNERAGAREGIAFGTDRVRFTGAAAPAMAAYGLGGGFAVEDVSAVAHRLTVT